MKKGRAGTLRSRPGLHARSRCPAPARIPRDRPGPSPRPRNCDRRHDRRFASIVHTFRIEAILFMYLVSPGRRLLLSGLRPERRGRARRTSPPVYPSRMGGERRTRVTARRLTLLVLCATLLAGAAALAVAGRRRTLDRAHVPGEVRPAGARPRHPRRPAGPLRHLLDLRRSSDRSSPACCPGPGSTSPRTTWRTSRARACASKGAPRAPSPPPTSRAGRAPCWSVTTRIPGRGGRGRACPPCATCRRCCSCRGTAARAPTTRSSGRSCATAPWTRPWPTRRAASTPRPAPTTRAERTSTTTSAWSAGTTPIPAGRFLRRPPGPGAFLIKNSWGTSYGQGGYFWLSYYDRSFGTTLTVFDGAEAAGNHDAIYQHDALGWSRSIGFGSTTAWFAARYTSGGDGSVTAASFYTRQAGRDLRGPGRAVARRDRGGPGRRLRHARRRRLPHSAAGGARGGHDRRRLRRRRPPHHAGHADADPGRASDQAADPATCRGALLRQPRRRRLEGPQDEARLRVGRRVPQGVRGRGGGQATTRRRACVVEPASARPGAGARVRFTLTDPAFSCGSAVVKLQLRDGRGRTLRELRIPAAAVNERDTWRFAAPRRRGDYAVVARAWDVAGHRSVLTRAGLQVR